MFNIFRHLDIKYIDKSFAILDSRSSQQYGVLMRAGLARNKTNSRASDSTDKLFYWAIGTVVLTGLTFTIPYLPFMSVLGFVPLSGSLLALLAAITLLYVVAAEETKRWFYRARRNTM